MAEAPAIPIMIQLDHTFGLCLPRSAVEAGRNADRQRLDLLRYDVDRRQNPGIVHEKASVRVVCRTPYVSSRMHCLIPSGDYPEGARRRGRRPDGDPMSACSSSSQVEKTRKDAMVHKCPKKRRRTYQDSRACCQISSTSSQTV
jgi:hypothetical protein